MLFVLIGLLKPDVDKDQLPSSEAVNEHLSQPFRRTHLAGFLCREGGHRAGLMMLVEADGFAQLSVVLGPPPKVIWLRIGNRPTRDVVALLRTRAADAQAFLVDPTAAVLELP